MIDTDLAKRLPRPLNHGATLVLLSLPTVVVGLGMLAIGSESQQTYSYQQCSTSAPPDLMVGLMCSLLTLAVTLLPIWLIFPPTRRAVDQDEDGLVWDRPRLPGGSKLLVMCLMIIGLALGSSTLLTRSIAWDGQYSRVGSSTSGPCSPLPAWVEQSIEVRRSKGVGVLLGYSGLCLFAGWLVRRRWRPTNRLELDERGLIVDGVHWSYKDITRAQVAEDMLCLEAHDGRWVELALFHREVAFAEQLSALIRSHLPAQTEERREAQRALQDLAERGQDG